MQLCPRSFRIAAHLARRCGASGQLLELPKLSRSTASGTHLGGNSSADGSGFGWCGSPSPVLCRHNSNKRRHRKGFPHECLTPRRPYSSSVFGVGCTGQNRAPQLNIAHIRFPLLVRCRRLLLPAYRRSFALGDGRSIIISFVASDHARQAKDPKHCS